jgi:hypothetical protein
LPPTRRIAREARPHLACSLFLDLAYAGEVPDPETLARRLVLRHDGAGISAWMDRDPAAARTAVAIRRHAR